MGGGGEGSTGGMDGGKGWVEGGLQPALSVVIEVVEASVAEQCGARGGCPQFALKGGKRS